VCSRREVVDVARRMARRGLVVGSLGNISCRRGDSVIITPTQRPYETMQPRDLVVIDQNGRVIAGRFAPSSEFRVHLAIYRAMPRARAVVHTHSIHAVGLSLVSSELPALTDEMGAVGGAVPVVKRAPPGTAALADAVAARMLDGSSSAAILTAHGVVAAGASPTEALAVCCLVERNAGLWLSVLRAGGPQERRDAL